MNTSSEHQRPQATTTAKHFTNSTHTFSSLKLGRTGLYYGHCRWCLVATVSLLWLLITRDIELLPVVGLATYFLAHFPAKWLALHAKLSKNKPQNIAEPSP